MVSTEPQRPARTGLPVEDVIPELRAALAGDGVAVLQAEPGAGKTTLVPLRLVDEPWLAAARIVVMEPRRVAARAAAARMANLLGEEVGATVGYVTRDDRRVSRSTRIEVVTDGILTRRLQHEPDLSGVAMVIFDEFHERRLEADLGLALTLDARSGLRPELRVLVMSATLEVESLATLLGGASVISSRGRRYPVALRWKAPPRPGRLATTVAAVVNEALQRDVGDVLTFLPGVGEIRAVASALGDVTGVQVIPLHGRLSAAEQDRVLRPGSLRRVVLSTDLAETSVTVEGVGVVVDAGLARRPMYDPATGLTKLRTVTTSRASADQRSGRAGRTAPGVAYRLWSEADHLARSLWSEPEILSAELAALVLELSVWGTRVASLRWLDPPPSAAVATARQLLEGLGALEDGRPTSLGRRLVELPVHPRLGRMLVAAPRPATNFRPPRCWRRCCPSAMSLGAPPRTARSPPTWRAVSRSSNATTTGCRPRSTAPQSLPSGGAPTSSSDALSERRRRIARRSRRCRWARPTTTQARCLPSRIPIESLSGEAVEGTGCVRAAARSCRRTIRWRAPSG